MKKIYTLLMLLFLLPTGLLAQGQQLFKLITTKAVGETLTFTVNRTKEAYSVDWGKDNVVNYPSEPGALREITGTLTGDTVIVYASEAFNTLICEGQGLKAVDISGAPNVKSLYLSHNALTSLIVKPLGKNLLDLDCSHNSLRTISVTVSNHPNIETLNVSDNDLGSIGGSATSTNYAGTFANLQYLNISNNGRIKKAVVSSNKKLDYIDCSNNAIATLSLPAEGVFTTIAAANNAITALDATPYSNLLQIDVSGNQIQTLDLGNTQVVKDVFAADNELTKVTFATRDTRDTLNICDLRNNRLFFNSLPRSNSKIRYININPQRPFPLTEEMGFTNGSVEVDGTTYYRWYVKQNPSYSQRGNEEYIVNLTSLRTDGNGNARNVISFINMSSPDSTALKEYTVASGSGDYTLTGVKYTFLNEYGNLSVRLTNSTGFYRNYTFYSEPFCVNEPTATGINDIEVVGIRADNAIFDLQGRKVTNPANGIYIIGGKKVFIK